jgi:hypothetical protein
MVPILNVSPQHFVIQTPPTVTSVGGFIFFQTAAVILH